VYQQAALEPDDSTILELPIDFRDGYTMWLQTRHERKMLAGYTSHILPEALAGLETELMRAMMPVQTDTDILGLPEHLPLALEELDAAALEDWRRELLEDKQVRFIVFHQRADFTAPPSMPGGNVDQSEKLRQALMPYRLNPAVRRAPQMRRFVVKEFQAGLAEQSTQARGLVELLFGPPDEKLGNLTTEVWDLRDEAESRGLVAEAEEGR